MKEKEARENLKSLPTFSNSNWIHKPSASVGYLEAIEKTKGLVEAVSVVIFCRKSASKGTGSPMLMCVEDLGEAIAKWEKEI